MFIDLNCFLRWVLWPMGLLFRFQVTHKDLFLSSYRYIFWRYIIIELRDVFAWHITYFFYILYVYLLGISVLVESELSKYFSVFYVEYNSDQLKSVLKQFSSHELLSSPILNAQLKFSDSPSSVIPPSVCLSVYNLFTFLSFSPEPQGKLKLNLM